jgi:putative redox protein
MTETQGPVKVIEDGRLAYAQTVVIGRHVLTADEPQARGGQNAGPSPYDYLLAGLGACTVITLRMYAKRHQWPLIRTSIDLWHEKIPSAGGSAVADCFHRVIHLEGELTDQQRSRLLQIAGHCPVSETLSHAAMIDTALAVPASQPVSPTVPQV